MTVPPAASCFIGKKRGWLNSSTSRQSSCAIKSLKRSKESDSYPSSLCLGTDENLSAVVGGLFSIAMLSAELGGTAALMASWRQFLIVSSIGLKHLMMRLPRMDHLARMIWLSFNARMPSLLCVSLTSHKTSLINLVPVRENMCTVATTFGTRMCSSDTRVPLVPGRKTRLLLVSIALHEGLALAG